MLELNQQIDRIEQLMQSTKVFTITIADCLEDGYIPNNSQYEVLYENLNRLMEFQKEINKNLEKIGVPHLSDSNALENVKSEVHKYYQSLEELNQIRNEMKTSITKFYSITSDVEKFKVAIEKEKSKLKNLEMNLINLSKNTQSIVKILTNLKPYNSFVKGVILGNASLEESEDECMTEALNMVAMKGLYLGRYYFDENINEDKPEDAEVVINEEDVEEEKEVLVNEVTEVLLASDEGQSKTEILLEEETVEKTEDPEDLVFNTAQSEVEKPGSIVLLIEPEDSDSIQQKNLIQSKKLEIIYPSKSKFGVSLFTTDVIKSPALLYRLALLTMMPVISERQFHEIIEVMLEKRDKESVYFAMDGFSKDSDKGYFVKINLDEKSETYYGLSQKGWMATQKDTVRKKFNPCAFQVKKIPKPEWQEYSSETLSKSINLATAYLSFLKYLHDLDRFDLHDSILGFDSDGDIYKFKVLHFSEINNNIIMANFENTDEIELLENVLTLAAGIKDSDVTILIAANEDTICRSIQDIVGGRFDTALFNVQTGNLYISEVSSKEETMKESSVSGEPTDIDDIIIVPEENYESNTSVEIVDENLGDSDLNIIMEEGSVGLATFLLQEGKISQDISLARKMTDTLLCENRLPLALVWAKASSKMDVSFDEYYHKLLLASDMDLDERTYDSDSVGYHFSEALSHDDSSVDSDYLNMLAAMVRALFRPGTAHDYTLLSYADQIIKSNQIFFDENPSTKYVISTLRGFLVVEPLGFTESTFAYIRDASQMEKTISDIKHLAQQLRSESLETNIGMIQVKQMLKLCFGKDSDIYQALSIVEQNRQESYKLVKNLFDSLAIFKDGEIDIDQEMLDAYIDEKWNVIVPNYFRKSSGFEHAGRRKVEKKFRERINVLGSWLRIILNNNSRATASEDTQKIIRKYRDDVINHGHKAIEELENHDNSVLSPGIAVLVNNLKVVCRNLENLKMDSQWIFKEFLQSNYIELNRAGIPVINHMFDGTIGYEPWRRVLQHIVSEPQDYTSRFNAVITDSLEMNRDDFGVASLIQQYLKSIGDTSEIITIDLQAACQNAEAALITHIDQFKSNFEMAYMHGSIDESKKEEMIQLSEDSKTLLLENNNYGFYMRFLWALTNNIKLLAKKRTDELRRQYETECVGKSHAEYPIRLNIEKLLDEGNIGLASEYIDNLRLGIKSIDYEINVMKSQDYHMEFLTDYDSIYDRCMTFKGKALRNQVERESRLLKSLHPDYTSRIFESSENLMKSWPRQLHESNLSVLIQQYFRELGFSVRSCVDDALKIPAKSQNWQTFKLYVNPPEKNLDYYNHPISKYGTQANEYFTVICMFGGINANEMIQTISKLDGGVGSNTIILLDNALTKPERRKIAEKYKSNTNWQNSFLVIDQVLTLFLATKRPEDRMEVLLKCTLPYTYFQPYNNDGGFIADEMFFGRKKELASILDPNGSSLVYGGRQLGKTALLLRAKSIASKPSNKEYTVFVNAQNLNSDQLVRQVSKELMSIRIIDQEISTWENLCSELRRKYEQQKYSKLLVLIDEVDDFLASINQAGYLPLKDLRELRRETSNNFKFVLAGLHNVTRLKSAQEKNSIIPQLGEPLSIKPLSPSDAVQLLKTPLSYLGYSFEDESLISMILLKTNYYPGLLHFFCYTLVQEVSEKYKKYYSSENNPPYILDNEKLKTILFEKGMNTRIKQKFFLNLQLDNRYMKIAYVLAYLFMDPFEEMPSGARGYSLEVIKNTSDVLEVPFLVSTPEDEYRNLLMEMDELGVLTHFTKEGITLYKFRKYDFSKMFGTDTEIYKHLEELD